MRHSKRGFRRLRPAGMIGSAVASCLIAGLLLGVAASAGRAETGCTLKLREAGAQDVHATRAQLFFAGDTSTETVHYTLEYAESPEGPWSVAGTATIKLTGGEVVNEFGTSREVHGLTPGTGYFGRVIVANGCASQVGTFEFETPAPSAPEALGLTVNQVEAGNLVAIGMTYGDFEADVEGNGAETEYRFEVRRPGEAWPGSPAAGEATSGTIAGTGAEDHVQAQPQMTGLSPETAYEVRVLAKSVLGESEEHQSFTTAPEHPEAFMGGFEAVAATSVGVSGGVKAHSAEAHWRFEYAQSESGPWSPGPEGTIPAPAAGAPVQAGEGFRRVEGTLTGLSPETVYYVRLHAENGHPPAATSRAESVEMAGKPVVLTSATHAFAPGGETIRVLGSVEPHGYDTHYHFQYVSQEAFEEGGWANAASSAEADAGSGAYGSGFPAKIIDADLPGLAPDGSYRYRLVASNSEGSVDGAEQTLTVPVAATGGEPACANQALRYGLSAHLPDCRAYEQVTPAEKKGSMDNWQYSGNISTPVAVGEDGEHVLVKAEHAKWGANPDAENSAYFFTREAGKGWSMVSATPQPQAGANSYRPDLFSGDLTQIGISVGSSNTTTGVGESPDLELMGGPPGGPYKLVMKAPRSSEPKWVAASPDFATLILSKAGQLYEWTGAGEPVRISGCQATIANTGGGGVPGGAVSEGGARIFFEAAPGCSGATHLYMRVDHSENVDLGAYRLLAANAARSLLLVERQNGGKYEYLTYDVESKTTKLVFALPVQVEVHGSQELSDIYLVSNSPLTDETPPISHESAEIPPGSNGEDVYHYNLNEGKLKFLFQTGGLHGSVSPDGRYLYFESTAVAGVFGEVDCKRGGGSPGCIAEGQVYRYDSVEHLVQCMSCASSFDPRPTHVSLFEAADLEEGPNGAPGRMTASANGDYVFFDSVSALVPQDVNGELFAGTEGYFEEEHDFDYSPSSDVYEWRKNGVDGCDHMQGCLALISSGTAGDVKNVLLGTDASGRDVFFATHSQLVGQDTDNQGDLYDARIGGGFPPPAAPATECAGDACVHPAAAPLDSTPSSLTFSGPGNATPKPAKHHKHHHHHKHRRRKNRHQNRHRHRGRRHARRSSREHRNHRGRHR